MTYIIKKVRLNFYKYYCIENFRLLTVANFIRLWFVCGYKKRNAYDKPIREIPISIFSRYIAR